MAKFYKHKKISDNLYVITDAAMTNMYLVIGETHAFLIDTGLGIGNLKEYVQTLTSKPVTILLTHGHLDHAMGAGSFGTDAEIYMNLADAKLYQEHGNLPMREDYYKGMKLFRGYKGILYPPKKEDWMKPAPVSLMKNLEAGMTFDIGTEVLEICPGKGHTPGCITVLLQKHRMLILGDACNQGTFLFDEYCSTVSDYRKMLLDLYNKTRGRCDRFLMFHGFSCYGEMDLIEGSIRLCELILQGKDRHISTERMGKPCYLAKKYLRKDDIGDHSTANIIYSDHTLR